MSIIQSFEGKIYKKLRDTIGGFDNDQLSDIYAISFFKSNADDDLRRPMITIGYNTKSRWISCTPKAGQEPAWPIASDSDEAKWNFAFWLQNEDLVIGGHEYNPVERWVRQLPFYYTDAQEDSDFDKALELGEKIQEKFMNIVIAHSQKLHQEGIITGKFGTEIPIIIHELEYYDKPLNWTRQGNPTGLAKEFEVWVEGFKSKGLQ
jgi:hypothetical protein